jgi:hypothetical protein
MFYAHDFPHGSRIGAPLYFLRQRSVRDVRPAQRGIPSVCDFSVRQ